MDKTHIHTTCKYKKELAVAKDMGYKQSDIFNFGLLMLLSEPNEEELLKKMFKKD